MTEEILSSVKEEFATKFSELDTRIAETTQQNIVLEIKQHVNHSVINYTSVKGQHYQLKPLIEVMGSGEPAMIIGPTGSGKTRVTHAVKKALGCKHYAIRQVNKQTATHDLIGFNNATGSYIPGVFTKIIQDGGLAVIDEIDNGNSNVLMIIKGILSGHIYMPYGMQEVNPKCHLMCTANTWGLGPDREYIGRNALDVALLNEFVCVEWPYDANAEKLWTLSLYKSVDEPKITQAQFDKFIDRFQAMRDYAQTNKIRVIFATRNLRQCVNLMAKAGWDEFAALDATVFRSVKGEQKRRLLEIYTEKRVDIRKPSHEIKDLASDEYKSKKESKPDIPEDIKEILDDDDVPF
jgi:cobaltochelatase CobS